MSQIRRDASSSPLSMASRSPELPFDYPSPLSDIPTEVTTPSKSRDVSMSLDGASDERDGPPPAKKRKVNPPKPRTTEVLDLNFYGEERDGYDQDHEDTQVRRLTKALRGKKKIVIIAGAGISVGAGIPDFRSSNGLFKSLKSQDKTKTSGKALFNADVYRSDDSTESFHDMVRTMSQLTKEAKPTRFHHMVASLAKEGRLLRMYTQNIDGIETKLEPLATKVPLPLKAPWPATIQLHGGLDKMVCTLCNELSPFKGELFEGPEAPTCASCEVTDSVRQIHAGKRSRGVGRLRPRIVLYNEGGPDADGIGACSEADLKTRPDAVIVAGTSLKIPGLKRLVKEMCAVTRDRKDGFTAWINKGPEPIATEFKDTFDLLVQGDCEDVAHVVNLPEWDANDLDNTPPPSIEDVTRLKKLAALEVVVNAPVTPSKPKGKDSGIPTPQSSRYQSPAGQKGAKGKQSKLAFGAEATSKAAASKASTSKVAVAKNATKASKSAPKAIKVSKIVAPKKKVGRPAKSTDPALKAAFAVTKSSTTATAEKNSKPKEPLFPRLKKNTTESTEKEHEAFKPVSPVAIRNNADVASYHKTLEVKDSEADSSFSSIDVASEDELAGASKDGEGKGYMTATVSPKGGIPRGMERFLH